jgi:hypothetical protein
MAPQILDELKLRAGSYLLKKFIANLLLRLSGRIQGALGDHVCVCLTVCLPAYHVRCLSGKLHTPSSSNESVCQRLAAPVAGRLMRTNM